jgi:hypothetical protein
VRGFRSDDDFHAGPLIPDESGIPGTDIPAEEVVRRALEETPLHAAVFGSFSANDDDDLVPVWNPELDEEQMELETRVVQKCDF